MPEQQKVSGGSGLLKSGGGFEINTYEDFSGLMSSLNVMLPEDRLGHTGLDVNYTKYSCKYYVYTLAHILI